MLNDDSTLTYEVQDIYSVNSGIIMIDSLVN